jgi:hypothetical protein
MQPGMFGFSTPNAQGVTPVVSQLQDMPHIATRVDSAIEADSRYVA